MKFYELVVDGKNKLYNLMEAGRVYDNGWIPVKFGTYVFDTETQTSTDMTDKDRKMIYDRAEDYSASK